MHRSGDLCILDCQKTMIHRKTDRVAGELEGVKTHLELDRRRKKALRIKAFSKASF